jgi:hypothetical protein
VEDRLEGRDTRGRKCSTGKSSSGSALRQRGCRWSGGEEFKTFAERIAGLVNQAAMGSGESYGKVKDKIKGSIREPHASLFE